MSAQRVITAATRFSGVLSSLPIVCSVPVVCVCSNQSGKVVVVGRGGGGGGAWWCVVVRKHKSKQSIRLVRRALHVTRYELHTQHYSGINNALPHHTYKTQSCTSLLFLLRRAVQGISKCMYVCVPRSCPPALTVWCHKLHLHQHCKAVSLQVHTLSVNIHGALLVQEAKHLRE